MDAYQTLKQQADAVWAARVQPGRIRIDVGMDSSNQHRGAAETLAALREAARRVGAAADVGQTGCNGMCWQEPIVVVQRPGEPAVTYGPVPAAGAEEFLDRVTSGDRIPELALGVDAAEPLDGIPTFSEQPYFQVQRRRLLARCGVIDPENVDHYIATGGYAGLDKALSELTPEGIVKELIDANLTGRGGANFPAGRKWDFLRTALSRPKYMICNADEGDPGAFVNRILMESDPHLIIEGMIIGAYVAGADFGFIYIRDEYPVSVERMNRALEQARERGLLGERILGSDFRYDMRVVRGAGAYVCGEETGLIQSINDYRGMPRIKPPFPAQAGVFEQPTNVNNVETYAYVPGIIVNGVDWFASVGTERAKGTKLFSLSGRARRVCIAEVDVGTSIRTLLEVCGGGLEPGRTLKGVQQGGPLGGVIPASWLDTPLEPAPFAAEGTIMGSGGLIFFDDRDCAVDLCKWCLVFDQDESCARCTTCRVGSMRMVDIMRRITRGQGTQQDVDFLRHLSGVMVNGNCVHGQFTPDPLNTMLKFFKDELDAHVLEKRCPAMACREMVEYRIPPGAATGEFADRLVAVCPVGAIHKQGDGAYIRDEECIRCDLCRQAAPRVVELGPKQSYRPVEREIRVY